MAGSSLYNQYNVYGAGVTPHYPLYMPGAKTFFVAPSGYTAVGGITPSDGNDGESPQNALATIGQAHTNMTTGRGDRIVLLPGTHTLTANVAITKTDGALLSYYPGMAVVNGAYQITIDGNNWEVAGIHFSNLINETGEVVVGQTTATARVWIHHNNFVGGTGANASGVVLSDPASGTAASYVKVEHNHFTNFDGESILTYGPHHYIAHNTIHCQDGDVGITLGDYGTAAAVGNRDVIWIIGNAFSGATNAGDEVGITAGGVEANTPLYVVQGNAFGHMTDAGNVVVSDIHPEGIMGDNWVGTASTSAADDVTG